MDTKKHKIISPMATGNGAYILHKTLEKNIHGYQVAEYSSKLEFMPFFMPFAISLKNADLIHAVPDHAIFFKRPSVPMVITFHNYVLDPWMKRYSTLLQLIHYRTDLKLFIKIAVSMQHTITAVSRYTAEIAKKNLGLNKDIKIIYNGIDSDFFHPNSAHRSKKNINVFFAGNISKRKGAQWLSGIAEKLDRDIIIHYTSGLRGNGMIKPRNNLIPKGSIRYFDMPNYYRQMDIVLLPTVREGLSLVVLEAMACGIPVVASDCSSLSEQIKNGKGGFLCPVGDVNAFAEKINILAESPKLRKEMGEYNRAKVEKYFTLERMIREYQNLFEEVLN
jgi:glycosyltransferase involved in cell wall biosynthesis